QRQTRTPEKNHSKRKHPHSADDMPVPESPRRIPVMMEDGGKDDGGVGTVMVTPKRALKRAGAVRRRSKRGKVEERRVRFDV
ncbi:MAG: hypothetical protein Q9216_004903, partial [Gyalolechia sp. 2 TL-2023]